MKRYLTILIVIIAGLGCTEWAVDSTEQGWKDFELGSLTDARGNFEDAIVWDPTYADAYNGLGWCDLLEDQLSSADVNFYDALSYESGLTDASAGASLVCTELGYHLDAIDYADDVINADTDYEFSHYTSVTIEDIRLTKAKSAAAYGDFQTALDEINELDASFSADPETAQGQADILAKIENLIAQYGE